MSANNKQKLKAAAGVVLVAVWCVFIFSMSANTGEVSQGMSDGLIAHVAAALHPGFAQLSVDEQMRVIGMWSFPVRKAAHFSEYALLGVLAANAVVQLARLCAACAYDGGDTSRKLRRALFVIAWAFCVLFAAGDEFHQLFVGGRSGQPFDVFVDSCGAAVGVLIARAAFMRSRRATR